MTLPEDDDARLARLARQTSAIRASGALPSRVMLAIESGAGFGLGVGFLRSARRLLPLAVLCAFAAVSWALASESAVTLEVASSYGQVELDF